jgi:peptidoglycan/xylan/chitin deacetylase (PgdA/CDA1 family)
MRGEMAFRFAALLFLVACKPPVPILNYHSVGAPRDEFTVSEAAFAAQLDLLAAQGYRTILLADIARGSFGPHDVVLTFDDGFDDARTVVLPALQKRGMRGTFFVVTSFVGRPGFLDWPSVEALRDAGMEIGSHTVDHLRLTPLAPGEVRFELLRSKRILERHLGNEVLSLAYPFNSVSPEVMGLAAEAGYRIGVAGPVHGGGDPLDLRRLGIKPGMRLEDLARDLRN